MHVEDSEGDTKYLYTLKLVPPEYLGSITRPSNIHYKNYP